MKIFILKVTFSTQPLTIASFNALNANICVALRGFHGNMYRYRGKKCYSFCNKYGIKLYLTNCPQAYLKLKHYHRIESKIIVPLTSADCLFVRCLRLYLLYVMHAFPFVCLRTVVVSVCLSCCMSLSVMLSVCLLIDSGQYQFETKSILL